MADEFICAFYGPAADVITRPSGGAVIHSFPVIGQISHYRGDFILRLFRSGFHSFDAGNDSRHLVMEKTNESGFDPFLRTSCTFAILFVGQIMDEGRIIDRNWANYDVCHAVIQPKNMTSEELLNGYFWAVRETYRLPNILHRIVRFQKGWKWRLAASYSYMRKAYKFCSPARTG